MSIVYFNASAKGSDSKNVRNGGSITLTSSVVASGEVIYRITNAVFHNGLSELSHPVSVGENTMDTTVTGNSGAKDITASFNSDSAQRGDTINLID